MFSSTTRARSQKTEAPLCDVGQAASSAAATADSDATFATLGNHGSSGRLQGRLQFEFAISPPFSSEPIVAAVGNDGSSRRSSGRYKLALIVSPQVSKAIQSHLFVN